MRIRDLALTLAAPLVLAAGGLAQGFNLDVGMNLILWPTPSPGYGGAAGQVGTWNAVDPLLAGTPIALDDLGGSPSAVTVTTDVSTAYNDPFLGIGGEEQNLLADLQDLEPLATVARWTFSGLADGDYAVYTYAWDPAGSARTDVRVADQPATVQTVGGAWPGGHALGVTYALHTVTVTGGVLELEAMSHDLGNALGDHGSINGFQLVPLGGGAVTAYCFGDGQGIPCPCGNANDGSLAGGQAGCANGSSPGGAALFGLGAPSVAADTLVLSASGLAPGQPGLYFQGANAVNGGLGTPFGDGLRCAGGGVVRLAVVAADAGGASQAGPGLGAAGGATPGALLRYQLWYRDPLGTPCGTGFNLTNGVEITWLP